MVFISQATCNLYEKVVGMTIEGKDYKLIPIDGYTPRFDLELLYEVKPRGRESRLEFRNVAYSISLDHAIKIIANYHINCNHRDEAVTLLEYLKEFTEELKFLKDVLC